MDKCCQQFIIKTGSYWEKATLRSSCVNSAVVDCVFS